MTKRSVLALLSVFVLVFGAAACGDDDESGSDGSSQDGGDATSPDQAIEDLGDVADEIEGLGGNLGECASIAASYGALGLATLGGEGSEEEVRGLIDDLEGNIPSELEEPFSVIADAYRQLAEDGILEGSDALDTPEFDAANAEIEAWVEENCAGLGG